MTRRDHTGQQIGAPTAGIAPHGRHMAVRPVKTARHTDRGGLVPDGTEA